MRTLLFAPQPFYSERGTPIAVKNLLQVMSDRGETVDVVTYHEGDAVEFPNVELHRIPDVPFLRGIRPGFSLKKLVADLLLALVAVGLLRRRRYDYIHAVEESAFIALVIKKLWGIPYVYDMDSSLAEQMVEKMPSLKVISPVFEYFERMAVNEAISVVPVCDALAETARRYDPSDVTVLYDVPLDDNGGSARADLPPVDDLRQKLDLEGLVVMYVGNLETYQGIDLLLDSFAVTDLSEEAIDLVIIGGQSTDIDHYRAQAGRLGIEDDVHLVGPRPVAQLSAYLSQADILVSPRTKGNNTPMKIYSYLNSGKAILATDLPTHTQVLNEDVSVLAEPTPADYGAALRRLAEHPRLREALGTAGRELIAEKYNMQSFSGSVSELLENLEDQLQLSAGPAHARPSA